MRLCLIIPALNEETIIAENCRQVLAFMAQHFRAWIWELVVVDNGSTDRTAAVVQALTRNEPHLRYLKIDRIGKGAAIRAGWLAVDADVYVFMDADLATDLSALPSLVAVLADGQADIAVGSRYAPGAVVERDWLRTLTSRGYQLVLRMLLGVHVADAPCGFKVINARVRNVLLPQVENDAWFFDTELLVRAERGGFRIQEIPVRWHEPQTPGRKSKVKIWTLAVSYLQAVVALRRKLRPGMQNANIKNQNDNAKS